MRRKAFLIVVVGGLMAFVLAACGGDDDENGSGGASTNGGQPLSKRDYISQADEICAQGTLEIAQRGQDRFGGEQPSSTEQVEAFAKEDVAGVLQDQADQLRALPPPNGDEKTVDAIYDALEDGVAELRRNPSLLIQQDVGGAFDEANRLAQAYGFQQCGEG